MDHTVPSTKVFSALLAGNIRQLHSCSSAELRPFLPCLSRIVLCPPATATMSDSTTSEWESSRTIIHTLIAGMQDVNAIREYLSLSFRELKQDAQKEQQLLRKLGPGEERVASQSVLASSLQFGLAIEFERSDYMRRFRLLLSEILRIVSQVCACTPPALSSSFQVSECTKLVGGWVGEVKPRGPGQLPVLEL